MRKLGVLIAIVVALVIGSTSAHANSKSWEELYNDCVWSYYDSGFYVSWNLVQDICWGEADQGVNADWNQ